MPRSKKSSKGKGAQGSASSKAKGPRGAMASGASVPFASTSGMRCDFRMSHSRRGQTDVIRVHIVDQLAASKAVNSAGGSAVSDAIPFCLASNSPSLSQLGQLLPKLQGLARICGRYQVLSARVHHQSLAPASSGITVGLAIVPGNVPASASLPELASYAHSITVPAWQNASSSRWVNAESRFFNTQDTPSAGAAVVPFTVLRHWQGLFTSGNQLSGLVWLEVDVEFIDLQPAPQSSLALAVGTPPPGQQTVSGSGSNASNSISYAVAQGMEGLFEWYFDTPGAVSIGASATATPPGSTIGVDQVLGQLDWWSELLMGAGVSLEKKGDNAVSVWSERSGKDELTVEEDAIYPQPWTRPYRKKVICKFRSYAEACRARDAGFDPMRIVSETPQTAGDFTVYLFFQPFLASENCVALYTALHSGGTGALTVNDSTSVTNMPAGDYFTIVIPTGTEGRTVGATSSMSLQVVQ